MLLHYCRKESQGISSRWKHRAVSLSHLDMMLPCRAQLLLLVSTIAVSLRTSYSLEYAVGTNGTPHVAVYSKPNSSIPVFEDQTYAELVSDWLSTQSRSIIPGRIDTHHHYIPDFYADYLEKYSTYILLSALFCLCSTDRYSASISAKTRKLLGPLIMSTFSADYTGLHLPWANISWSADASLQFMESLEIEMAVLSISTPGIPFGQSEEVRDIARKVTTR